MLKVLFHSHIVEFLTCYKTCNGFTQRICSANLTILHTSIDLADKYFLADPSEGRGLWPELRLRIREIQGSNLGRETDYSVVSNSFQFF
jgi:hypothetical protein